MTLQPIVKEDGRPVKPSAAIMGECHKAVTKYRVLSENGSAALVHCTPETGEFNYTCVVKKTEKIKVQYAETERMHLQLMNIEVKQMKETCFTMYLLILQHKCLQNVAELCGQGVRRFF